MATGKVEAVKAGEVIQVTFPGSTPRTETMTVKAPCANKTGGQWYCLTHQQGFINGFMKDTHIHHGNHRLVWVCMEHGPEQP